MLRQSAYMGSGWRPIAIYVYCVRLIWTLALLVACGAAWAFGSSMDFRVAGPAEGLSHNAVTSFLEDREGYLWIGTEDGLNRFDGHRYRQFLASADERGLSDAYVTALRQDRAGRIWIATTYGLNRYDPATERFHHYYQRPGLVAGLAHNRVNAILETRSGELWFASHGGLSRYRPETDDFESLRCGGVWALIEDGAGQIWFLSNAGLSLLDTKRLRVVAMPAGMSIPDTLASRQTGILAPNTDGGFLVATRHEVNRYDPRSRHYAVLPDLPALNDVEIKSLLVDRRGRLWIGSNTGIVIWDARDGSLRRLRHDPANPQSLSHNMVRTLFEDKRGLIWIGTSDRYAVYNPDTEMFAHYRNESGLPDSLSGNSIYGMHQDRDGALWVSTALGLNRISADRRQLQSFLPERSAHFTAIGEDRHGHIWLSDGHALLALNPADGLAQRRNPEGEADKRFVARAFELDAGQRLWVASDYGLYRYDDDSGRFDTYLADVGRDDTLCDNEVYALRRGRDGRMWIGTRRGLAYWRPESRSIRCYRPGREQAGTLEQGWIFDIHENQNGRLWLATSEGLAEFDPGSGRFRRYGSDYGLPNSYVYGVEEDDSGWLWLSSNRGLYAFDPRTNTSRRFDATMGLQGDIYNVMAHAKLRDGSLVFGGDNGFSLFHPQQARMRIVAPASLLLTEFRLNNRPVSLSMPGAETALAHPLSQTDEVRLSWDYGIASFEFSALDFGMPDVRRYRYRLEGFGNDWIEADARQRLATFSGLAPGEYRFRVQTAVAGGGWEAPGVMLKLNVTPPWWRSAWAYGAAVALLIGAVAAWLQGQRRRLRALEVAEARGRMQLTEHATRIEEQNTQLAQQAEALSMALAAREQLFARVSHEFRTPLTLILSPLQGLIQRLHGSSEGRVLAVMRRNAETLLSLVDQLLHLARMGGVPHAVARTLALDVKARSIFESFEDHAHHCGISLQYSIAPHIFVHLRPGTLTTVLNNLLGNALKYTQVGGTVTVAGYVDGGAALLEVVDDGPGVPEAWRQRIFEPFERGPLETHKSGFGIGLYTVKELIVSQGGSIELDSAPVTGSCFRVRFPLAAPSSGTSGDVSLADEVTGLEDMLIANGLVELPRVDGSSDDNLRPAADSSACKTVLIIEDNADLRDFLAESLATDYDCVTAASGDAGLVAARERLPDLILCDVDLPGTDGFSVCTALKSDETTCHIPLFFLTAYTAREQRLRGLMAQGDDYLGKPFDLDELRLRIANRLSARERLRNWLGAQTGLDWQRALATIESEDGRLANGARAFRSRIDVLLAAHHANPDYRVTDLASAMHKTVRTLQRQFEVYGMGSPNEYLRNYRLDVANKMLHEDVRIADIALACGLDPKSFAEKFKARFGVAPNQYRAQIRAGDAAEIVETS